MNSIVGIRLYTIVEGDKEREAQKGSENITKHTYPILLTPQSLQEVRQVQLLEWLSEEAWCKSQGQVTGSWD